MKNILLDLTALTGVGAVMAGCYLKYGLENTLIAGGILIIAYTLAVAKRGRNAA